ncbi:MAG: hypothetical protein ACK55I_13535, partial [bacterium]
LGSRRQRSDRRPPHDPLRLERPDEERREAIVLDEHGPTPPQRPLPDLVDERRLVGNEHDLRHDRQQRFGGGDPHAELDRPRKLLELGRGLRLLVGRERHVG